MRHRGCGSDDPVERAEAAGAPTTTCRRWRRSRRRLSTIGTGRGRRGRRCPGANRMRIVPGRDPGRLPVVVRRRDRRVGRCSQTRPPEDVLAGARRPDLDDAEPAPRSTLPTTRRVRPRGGRRRARGPGSAAHDRGARAGRASAAGLRVARATSSTATSTRWRSRSTAYPGRSGLTASPSQRYAAPRPRRRVERGVVRRAPGDLPFTPELIGHVLSARTSVSASAIATRTPTDRSVSSCRDRPAVGWLWVLGVLPRARRHHLGTSLRHARSMRTRRRDPPRDARRRRRQRQRRAHRHERARHGRPHPQPRPPAPLDPDEARDFLSCACFPSG